MQLEPFRQSLKVANLVAFLSLVAGIAMSVHLDAIVVGTLFTLALAFTVHGLVYAVQCRRRVSNIEDYITGARDDDGPHGMGVISYCRPTGDVDADFYLDVYASMRHRHRHFFSGLHPVLLIVGVVWIVLSI